MIPCLQREWVVRPPAIGSRVLEMLDRGVVERESVVASPGSCEHIERRLFDTLGENHTKENINDSGDRDFIGNVDQLLCRDLVTIPSMRH